MATKIIALLHDETLYRHCSRNAVAMSSRFDYDRVIAEYALTYRQLAQPCEP
jgi:hypothetical protein